MSNPVDLLPIAMEATRIAVDLIKTVPTGRLTAKGDRDMATETDYAIERAVRAFLAEETPGIGFLGEEDGISGADGDDIWTLDPIDGTVNFLHQLPLCAVSLALIHKDQPVLGVVELPRLGHQFSAAHGHGAFEDGHRISPSLTSELRDAVVAIGDYSVGEDAAAANRQRIALTAQLAAKVQRVRMFGSAAIDLVWLASGRIDASIVMSNNAWDMAAGVIIAREAGALVLDADGSHHTTNSHATVATTPALRQDLIALIAAAQ